MSKSALCGCCFFLLSLLGLNSCHSAEQKDQPEDKAAEGQTPVTVTTVSHAPMTEYLELNAVSTFLQKGYVKANANGYLQSEDVYPGKFVKHGELLFRLKTKEAQTLGNTINVLDSTMKFSGLIDIYASISGYVTALNHQPGDYVQDGEQLAAISDISSFAFLLDLPYELRPLVMRQKTVELILPDGERLTGTLSSIMPSVDAVSQTQAVVIRVNPPHAIPENLVAKVRIVKSAKSNTMSLPKAALLSNETQNEFWVMKMIDSVTAVKVPIKKGMEADSSVEILSPAFLPGDKILVTGNYGLPDTAKVKIEPAGP
jgi:multidrug efflux pump subunit AcrA (membrane-fusion protein)